MTRSRPVRGAGALIVAAALAALAGCSGASGAGASGPTSGTEVTTPAASTPATPTKAAPSSTGRKTTKTPRSTAGADASATRTVYAGPSRTSTLVPWDEPTVAPGGGPTPSAAAGRANLRIMLDDGFGIRAYWTLTCAPVGGSHPYPKKACGVLGAHGAKAFVETEPDAVCDQQYGGPQKALVTGTWQGRTVRSQFTLENGCEVARWTAMIGFLPPGGV